MPDSADLSVEKPGPGKASANAPRTRTAPTRSPLDAGRRTTRRGAGLPSGGGDALAWDLPVEGQFQLGPLANVERGACMRPVHPTRGSASRRASLASLAGLAPTIEQSSFEHEVDPGGGFTVRQLRHIQPGVG